MYRYITENLRQWMGVPYVLYSGKYHNMSLDYPLEWSHEEIWLASKTVQMKLPAKCPLNTSQQSVENVECWFTFWPPSNAWSLCQENLRETNSLSKDSYMDSCFWSPKFVPFITSLIMVRSNDNWVIHRLLNNSAITYEGRQASLRLTANNGFPCRQRWDKPQWICMRIPLHTN